MYPEKDYLSELKSAGIKQIEAAHFVGIPHGTLVNQIHGYARMPKHVSDRLDDLIAQRKQQATREM